MKNILKNIRNDLSKKFHPDVGGSNEGMKAINAFYETVVDKLSGDHLLVGWQEEKRKLREEIRDLREKNKELGEWKRVHKEQYDEVVELVLGWEEKKTKLTGLIGDLRDSQEKIEKLEKWKRESEGLKWQRKADSLAIWKRESSKRIKMLEEENDALLNQVYEFTKQQTHSGANMQKINILGWSIAKSGEYFRAHKKMNGKTKSIYIGKTLDEAEKIIEEKSKRFT